MATGTIVVIGMFILIGFLVSRILTYKERKRNEKCSKDRPANVRHVDFE